jgi:hypothetical protein
MLVSEILGVRNGSNEKPKSDMETIGDGTGTGTPFWDYTGLVAETEL